ncbi:hypothetical protein H6F42_15925 [Pseudanabaena sp. FACHB-1998]|uniref:hypothetical protein n=1 Tax=Pseudanabaena sp. FACHB-1998 TaxID=2692858 RepID=UPI001681B003|nr:hypothetical protein [Pseudanabaena sp. FACHB-1998]MBD2178408.1 hypothetical protein [Pseudanabaena sp. FACHB-1998]
MSKERTEALDNAIRLMHNQQVRDYFKDIPDGDTSESPRASTKRLLILEDNDSSIYQLRAMEFFKKYCEEANGTNNLYFSVPVSTYNYSLTYLPQITCYFRQEYQSSASEETKTRARTMQVSMRVRETKIPESVAALRSIATDIKNAFGTPIYRYRTGYRRASYFNRKLGYEFKVSCRDIPDAENLIKAMMGIFSDRDEFDPRDLKISEPRVGATVTSLPKRKTRVVSKLVNLPEFGESVRMFFTHADYKCYPARPIILVKGGTLVY